MIIFQKNYFLIQFWDTELEVLTVFHVFTINYIENRWVIKRQSQILSKLAVESFLNIQES